MDIKQAKLLTLGAVVSFPADRGDAAGSGRVMHLGSEVAQNIHGAEYIWVTVRSNDGQSQGVWPSNRLSASHLSW